MNKNSCDYLVSTVCHNLKMGDKDCGDPVAKSRKISSALDQLKQYTTVVADTGDFEGKVGVAYVH